MEGTPFYLYHYWADENYFPDTNKLDSSAISNLFAAIGRDEKRRFDFMEKWAQHINPDKALFFDISSISSYSTNIDFIEWGYNRDKENLPQINLGMVFCEDKKLPVNYCLYPGSIVDVTTLKNCKKYLTNFGLNDFLFILDRGFFSTANVLEMNDKDCCISFIQPLPFSLKKAKRNIRNINSSLSRSGYYILATNKTGMSHEEVLTHYRNKDLVEKVFDVLKNEMDGKRLRTHNDHTTTGKLFVMFISLVIYYEIIRVMNQNKLFKTYTIKELLYELRKIKINHIAKDGKPIVSEVSKKQKTIFNPTGKSTFVNG